MPGYRATIVVEEPAACPVADASAASEQPVDSVRRTHATDGGVVVEEFTTAGPLDTTDDLEVIQDHQEQSIYRFERASETDCVCEVLEGTGTPIRSVTGRDGALALTFHTSDLEDIAHIVETLRERFDGVLVEELLQDHGEARTDPVVVDRAVLTDRQAEIIETAHELGYFEYPKRANATEVAEAVGVARSTFSEHLAAAQTKLLEAVLDS